MTRQQEQQLRRLAAELGYQNWMYAVAAATHGTEDQTSVSRIQRKGLSEHLAAVAIAELERTS